MEHKREKIREYMFSIRSVEYCMFSDSIRCVSIRFVSIRFVKYTFCKCINLSLASSRTGRIADFCLLFASMSLNLPHGERFLS
jgi:hypothetical protein